MIKTSRWALQVSKNCTIARSLSVGGIDGGFRAESMSEMEDVLNNDVIGQYLNRGGKPSQSLVSSPKSWTQKRSMGTTSSVALEIAQMERESNFMQIREAARELTTILDVTRYARSYLPGKLVNTEQSIAFISDELMLPLLPNENFLATWERPN